MTPAQLSWMYMEQKRRTKAAAASRKPQKTKRPLLEHLRGGKNKAQAQKRWG